MWNTCENKVELIFIRHGKTPGNLEGRYIGRTDESLCEDGKNEIRKKEYPNVDAVFVSPMKRCVETAGIIYPELEQIVIEEFKEMDFGDFEGKNYSQLNGNPDYQKYIDSGGKTAFPNGEALEGFIKRVMEGYAKMQIVLKEKNITKAAVVVHGGTIMACLSSVLGGDYFDYQIKNGETYKCSITL